MAKKKFRRFPRKVRNVVWATVGYFVGVFITSLVANNAMITGDNSLRFMPFLLAWAVLSFLVVLNTSNR